MYVELWEKTRRKQDRRKEVKVMRIEVKGKEKALEDLERAQKLIKEAESILYHIPLTFGLEICDTEKAPIEMNNNNLGNKINDLLKQNGMTQGELAAKTGITEKFMSNIINGNRTPLGPTVANIANALHTTPDYLLGTEETL